MKEEYLHHVFKKKMLGNTFNTINNKTLKVLDFGEHNTNAGPDFLDAKISYDGHVWAGPIEFHVNASDWYKHKHQHDPAYDNVVAHFVYKSDAAVQVKDFIIPTVEIAGQIDAKHYQKYKGLMQSTSNILCRDQIRQIDEEVINKQLNLSLKERLWRKALVVIKDIEANAGNRDKAFLLAVARVFGGQVNQLPFQTLVEKLEVKWLAKLNYDSLRTEALIFGISGLLNFQSEEDYVKQLQTDFLYQKKMFDIVEMPLQNWKYSRMRPHNFPDLRLAQFNGWLNSRPLTNDFLTANWDLENWRDGFKVELDPFWKNHFRLKGPANKLVTTKLTDGFIDLIFINAVVPYIYAIGLWEGNDAYAQQAQKILKQIKPEKNTIISEWKKTGLNVASAFETQSLLELKKQGCNRKKCLFCALGKTILSRTCS
ncbi:MAG: DUF2851 family protein [Crocinitomix sp.]|nr:DUF2851 family protein [Crocinitomix sp.]